MPDNQVTNSEQSKNNSFDVVFQQHYEKLVELQEIVKKGNVIGALEDSGSTKLIDLAKILSEDLDRIVKLMHQYAEDNTNDKVLENITDGFIKLNSKINSNQPLLYGLINDPKYQPTVTEIVGGVNTLNKAFVLLILVQQYLSNEVILGNVTVRDAYTQKIKQMKNKLDGTYDESGKLVSMGNHTEFMKNEQTLIDSMKKLTAISSDIDMVKKLNAMDCPFTAALIDKLGKLPEETENFKSFIDATPNIPLSAISEKVRDDIDEYMTLLGTCVDLFILAEQELNSKSSDPRMQQLRSDFLKKSNEDFISFLIRPTQRSMRIADEIKVMVENAEPNSDRLAVLMLLQKDLQDQVDKINAKREVTPLSSSDPLESIQLLREHIIKNKPIDLTGQNVAQIKKALQAGSIKQSLFSVVDIKALTTIDLDFNDGSDLKAMAHNLQLAKDLGFKINITKSPSNIDNTQNLEDNKSNKNTPQRRRLLLSEKVTDKRHRADADASEYPYDPNKEAPKPKNPIEKRPRADANASEHPYRPKSGGKKP